MPPHRGPAGGPERARLGGVMQSRGEYTDVEHVLDEMVRLATQYNSDPRLRDRVQHVTRGIEIRDREAVAQAVWEWIRENVRYVRDPQSTELLQSPERVLQTPRYADCDGMAVLAASMLSSVGIPVGFRAIAREEPGAYDHVYAVYEPHVDGKWHALDPTAPYPPGPDTQTSRALSQKTVPLSEMSSSNLSARSTSSGLSVVGSSQRSSMGVYPPPDGSQDGEDGDVSTTSDGQASTTSSENNEIWRTAIDEIDEIIGAFRNGGGGNGDGSTQPDQPTQPPATIGDQQQAQIFGMSPTTLLLVGGGGLGVALLISNMSDE